MKRIYGVVTGIIDADTQVNYTESREEALREAEYISSRVTKRELKKGYFVEVAAYDFDDDISIEDLKDRYPDPGKEERILNALGNYDRVYYYDL